MSFVKLPILRHGLMVRDEEILPDPVVAGRIEKVRELMQTKNVEALLVYSDPTNGGPACYLTNYPCFGLGRRATVVLSQKEGPFLFTAEPSRNLPRVRRFTTCDIEKTRRFLSAACEHAKKLSGDSALGLVNLSNLPLGLVKDTEELSGLKVKDISRDFILLLAAKDESSLKATNRAVDLAAKGVRALKEQAASGKDLWHLAAEVDYQLRLFGCEDTNILLGSSARGQVRPGYPARIRPSTGDIFVVYVAAQYARQWGVIGTTLSVGVARDNLNRRLSTLSEIQKKVESRVRAGMTLGRAEAAIIEIGREVGVSLSEDLPVVGGVGFDLSEYPVNAEDRVEKDMVLQVTLAVDVGEEFTAMLVTLLQITSAGCVWLTGRDCTS
jgi:Xaa-Pro aminopeptidase